MSNYSSQLRDRRWQKKRLEILERDGFTCRICGSEDNTEQLHIHHLFYRKGAAPWEYPNEALVSVCASCHEEVSEVMNEFLMDLFIRFPDISFFDTLRCSVVDRDLSQLIHWLAIPPGRENAWKTAGGCQ